MTDHNNEETKVFNRNSAHEDERVPKGGQTPRSSDTEVGAASSPDPDIHPEAAADASTDAEAGADVRGDDRGGIEPLRRR